MPIPKGFIERKRKWSENGYEDLLNELPNWDELSLIKHASPIPLEKRPRAKTLVGKLSGAIPIKAIPTS